MFARCEAAMITGPFDLFEKIFAFKGVRRKLSSTTLKGVFEEPFVLWPFRTLKEGLSFNTVFTPTRIASEEARSVCENSRASLPVIQRDSPVFVAILPSKLCATLMTP